MRLAMWSGPRNLSTAMMYAFGARDDCAIWDEPFYAAYLAKTGLEHPMREEIIAAGKTDPDAVARACTGPVPAEKPHFYMKHMAHHLIDGFPMGWLSEVTNVFLIRHPARVVASYVAKRENPEAADLGFDQLLRLHDHCVSLGQSPVVIDSADILADPARALAALCERVGLSWTPDMLRWKPGGNPDDGVWAAHWYGAVHRSSGFGKAEGPLPVLEGRFSDLERAARPAYDAMAARRMIP
jgi:hypothetical protein